VSRNVQLSLVKRLKWDRCRYLDSPVVKMEHVCFAPYILPVTLPT